MSVMGAFFLVIFTLKGPGFWEFSTFILQMSVVCAMFADKT